MMESGASNKTICRTKTTGKKRSSTYRLLTVPRTIINRIFFTYTFKPLYPMAFQKTPNLSKENRHENVDCIKYISGNIF